VAELISMPKLGFDMAEGKLQEWLKKVGDTVAEGETIGIVETDKASVDVPAFRSGVLLKILVEAGSSVPIGAPIAVIGSAGETVDPAVLGLTAAAHAPAAPAVQEPAEAEAAPEPAAEAVSAEEGRLFASPVAARMAAELGIDLRQVSGSGPAGRIIKRDIEAYLQEREKAPAKLHRRAALPDAPDHRPAYGREQTAGASLLHHHGCGYDCRNGVARPVERTAS
jgi:pyruvate dehydrogenase E2 component (dihydrolipoamide acetyltransferase)